ncbi:unnamed protein product [Coffea canephora]|uniref:Uncharacterized protein n=1 Tax=Coffea canephora TaxID=49390 RepID=A0A068V7H1_COFCA|nr:unnamed protein product [Coffea canephora]
MEEIQNQQVQNKWRKGLTVFRDPVYIFFVVALEFSSDVGSSTVKRIADVLKLRIYQYPQDAGPMAHPLRPHFYIKVLILLFLSDSHLHV